MLGDDTLAAVDRAHRESVVRALLSAYSHMSDVLHGRRVALSPDPVDLERWERHVRAGCELLPSPEGTCPFCMPNLAAGTASEEPGEWAAGQ